MSLTDDDVLTRGDLVAMCGTTQPWMRTSLQPAIVPAHLVSTLDLAHHATNVSYLDPEPELPRQLGYGSTTWVCVRRPGPVIAIAWDWVLVSKGVLVVANQLAIVSNLFVIDDEGETLSEDQRLLALMLMVHRTPWQERVCEHLPKQFGRRRLTTE